uniref:Uncharacterized protein n=1 Tax=Setaria viridis TaxID=4556 RepID=A0A4U6UHF7_SETVI|nr:hypothetical protein SEVIR_5G193700v2 [Setaria viridis]
MLRGRPGAVATHPALVADLDLRWRICNVESHAGDRGALARCSGDYAVVISQNTTAPPG